MASVQVVAFLTQGKRVVNLFKSLTQNTKSHQKKSGDFLYLCAMRDLNITCSVQVVTRLFPCGHKRVSNLFSPLAYKNKIPQAKRLKYFILVRDERHGHE